ncbi:type II toxin-antitoxin system RelE/ParE family toxin [Desulfobotulus sp. H1]|uniref:Type II toxin-antitoxin system RelE/ParE family toxin n=1 Tax=Desulfobotulus pelophilus TaxID=2823377 RepID=A0ABT3N7V9_9BACT|nr:type II toxin-antitoxin system RelE/ParE family toxin [Desulfobotulus pelophilus]MCW7753540.1 type II toxin-antitoxin system RelE/ParE family toxin [Desulfobotulus pelophilus]
MVEYKILFRKSVEKDLLGIRGKDVIRILERIKSLENNPRPPGYEKLTGQDRYRLRQGQYRIVYSIQDNELTIWVVAIGHRKDVYQKLP